MDPKSQLTSDNTSDTLPANRFTLRKALQVIAALFTAFIIFQSLRPDSGVENLSHVDKLMHLMAYCAFVFLIGLSWPRIKIRYIVFGAVIGGILLEIAQGVMGMGRVVSLGDIIANTIGALIGMGVLYYCIRRTI